VAVGRPRVPLAPAVAEYEARAARYWPFEAHEVREEPARGALSGALLDRVRALEGERLLARVPAGAIAVACDERGETWTSERFAAWLRERRDEARDVAFVVGGAHGLAPAVREAARVLLAVAPWTVPHEMARLVLAEQLYRAGTIVRGEPYHK